MKAKIFTVAFAVLFCAMSVAPPNSGAIARAQERGRGESGGPRLLLGQVTDRRDKPIPSAVVYLKNRKNLAVKTYISGEDGSYRFPALSPNVDYEVYAEFQGKRSSVKTLSAFNSRREARINLKIDQ